MLKRTISAGMVLLLLITMVTASASTAGTITDPLISISYLDGTFLPALRTEMSGILGGAADGPAAIVDGLYPNYSRYDFASGFMSILLADGDTVMLAPGSSFILISGSAALSSLSGVVIDVSTGQETESDSQLILFNRYFCVEDTMAIITATSAAIGQIDGFYRADTTVPSGFHPVFNDVPASAWFYPAVDYVYSNNLFQGTTPTTFSPGASMTRGMFVTVLHRLDGLPEVETDARFNDVSDASQYFYDAVAWANANNIVTGYNSSTFGPNDFVTREQMAAIMYRYALYNQRDVSSSPDEYDAFPDSESVSEYAVEAMQWAVSSGIIGGSEGRLLPQSAATRAQVAQIISNYASG